MKLITFIFLVSASLNLSAQSLKWLSGIEIIPETCSAGQPVTFAAVLSPAGGDVHNIVVKGGIDGTDLITQQFQILKQNQTQKIIFSSTATEGSHSVYFTVSANPESPSNLKILKSTNPALPKASQPVIAKTEKNFQVSAPIVPVFKFKKDLVRSLPDASQPVCEGRLLPDLVVADISISGSGMPGDIHYISADIENRGQCGTGPFQVSLKVIEHLPNVPESPMILAGTKKLTELSPMNDYNSKDASETVDFEYRVKSPVPADYEFIIQIDPNNAVEEFRENNNEASKQITIK